MIFLISAPGNVKKKVTLTKIRSGLVSINIGWKKNGIRDDSRKIYLPKIGYFTDLLARCGPGDEVGVSHR